METSWNIIFVIDVLFTFVKNLNAPKFVLDLCQIFVWH